MADDEIRARTLEAIRAVWAVNRPAYLERADELLAAGEAMEAGGLGAEARSRAIDAAHKLAGALGMFGYPTASQLARDIEQLLKGEDGWSGEDGGRLITLSRVLRNEISRDP